MDEGASSGEKHQLGAVQPIVNCDKKASYNVILTTSIVVATFRDNIVML